ncbi:MAG: hemolysin family protein [Candidatus Omnitrophota bacterium]
MYLIIIFIAIMLEGLFSGAEIAIISLNRIRLRILSEAKDKKAMLIHKMLSDPDRLLCTTLVGTNFAVVIASSFCTKFIYDTYGIKSEWLTALVLSPLVLVFGEFVPKAVFSQSADRITFSLASFLKFFWKLFYPVVALINWFVNLLFRSIRGTDPSKKRSVFVTREEIMYLIRESEAEGVIDPYERSMIYKIFDFGKKKSKDIMRKLEELVYLKDSSCIEDLLSKASESGYSRFPIRAEAGGFLGIVNILDVVYEEDKKLPINQFIRPIEYIDAAMDIDKALFLLQSKKQSLAVVKDQEGVPAGFFTMDDLLEELVGEI